MATNVNAALAGQHANFLQSYFANASREELAEAFIAHLRKEHSFSHEEVNALFANAGQEHETLLPINVFNNDRLSALETIVKYLKENKQFTFHNIAVLLNRDDRTIWATYAKSRKKMMSQFHLQPSKYLIPATIFAARKLSVLETLAHHLNENLSLSLHEIAQVLNRDDSTIWTVCHRAAKKLEAMK